MKMFWLLSVLACKDKVEKEVDRDNDGYPASEDCNDANELIHPDAEEICDFLDNDCDGLIDDEDDVSPTEEKKLYLDDDNDGFGDMIENIIGYCFTPPNTDGYIETGGDCDDSDPDVNPNALEICDFLDNDCDALIDDEDDSVDMTLSTEFYIDNDLDGFGSPSDPILACSQPENATPVGDDCNDQDATISPDAEEDCSDGIDNDCDGFIDAFDGNCIASNPLRVSLSLLGTQRDSQAGFSVASAKDVNNDAWPDMLVGAPEASYGTGEVYLTVSYPLFHSGSLYDSTHVFRGEQTASRAGNALAGLGDTNGNGRGDILIAAEHTDLHDTGVPNGAVYLFSGLDIVSWTPRGLNEATVLIQGRNGERFGREVSALGDINGDGLNDYIVSAPGSSAYGTDNQGVYIFHGGEQYTSSADAAYQIRLGRTDSERHVLAEVGDINGDGVADILVGAKENRGDAHLFWGNNHPEGILDAEDVDVVFASELSGDKAHQIASAGDINDDQKMDIMIGAPFNDQFGTDSGKSYLLLGSDIPDSGSVALRDARYHFHGESPNDLAGYVHNAGDINNDADLELLIGAPGFSGTYNNQGKLYSILLNLVTLSSSQNIESIATHTLEGSSKNAKVGRRVAAVGDINRSGLPAIAIGLPERDDFRRKMGGADLASLSYIDCFDCVEVCDDGLDNEHDSFVDCFDPDCFDEPHCNAISEICNDGIDNDADGLIDCIDADCNRNAQCASESDILLLGEGQYNRAGWKIKDIGDIDGDGLPDMLIAAPNRSESNVLLGNSGKAYIMKGSTLLNTQTLSLQFADIRFIGESAGDLMSWDVSSAGDIDGDGLSDVMMSAPRSNENGENSGKVFIFLAANLQNIHQVPLATADYIFVGDNEHEYLGTDIDGDFDINGDGNNDVVFSALTRDQYNRLYAVAHVVTVNLLPPGTYDISSVSHKIYSHEMSTNDLLLFPSAIGVDDIDGDGLSEIALGSRGVNYPYFECGGVYVQYSSSINTGSSAPDVFIHGDEAGAWMGFLHSAGDIDEDGLGDILIGQENETTQKSYIHNGNRLGTGSRSVVNANYSFDLSGRRFSYISDIDGDGRNDYIFSGEDDLYLISGSVFSHYGDIDFPLDDVTYTFPNKGGEFATFGVLSDLDGDGLDELWHSNIYSNLEQGLITWINY